MCEPPSSVWKRPWHGLSGIVAWLVLLASCTFLIICIISFLTQPAAPLAERLTFSVIVAGVVALIVTIGILFVTWLFRGRNFLWFSLGVASLIAFILLAYAEENWRGKHDWQAHRRQLEARGEKLSVAALTPPPVPDAQNFALTPLLKPMMDLEQGPKGTVWRDTNGIARLDRLAVDLSPGRSTNDQLVLGSLDKGTFADLGACANFYRGNTNYPQAAPTASPAEVILVALGKFAPELEELNAAAAARPYSRFPIAYAYQPAWGILLPHLAHMKGLTRLTEVSAVAELEAGRADAAFADLKLGLRFSDSISKEPLLIDHLVRIAALALDLQTVREGLVRHAWTEAQLAELEKYLATLDLLAEYELAMHGERALSTEGLEYLRRQGFRTNPMDVLGDGGGSASCSPGFNLMPSGWYYQNMLTMSRMHEEFTFPAVDARAHRVLPEVSAKGERALEKMRTGPYTIFARLLLPALGNVAPKSARMQTYVDAARVACALERYRLANGNLPDSLAALTPKFADSVPNDVIDGKPLRYQLKPDGAYVLYSIGWNQVDDGGTLAWKKPQEKEGLEITKGDWVWELQRAGVKVGQATDLSLEFGHFALTQGIPQSWCGVIEY